jgi:hypothetical protein
MPERGVGRYRKAGRTLLLAGLLLPASALAILDGVPAEQEPAVAGSTLAVVIEDTSQRGPDGRPGYYPSSGVVIAPNWILTVKHSFAKHNGPQHVWQLHLAPEIVGGATGDRVRVLARSSVIFHPTLDLALVRLDAPMPFEYRPVKVVSAGRHLAREATLGAVLAGYGTAGNKPGPHRLNYVVEPISALSVANGPRQPELIPRGQADSHLEVDQRDGRGSCRGDSGGPVFVKLADGGVGLLGVILGNASYSGGHPCLGYTYAVRIDRALAWVTQVTGRFYDPASMLLVDAFSAAATPALR